MTNTKDTIFFYLMNMNFPLADYPRIHSLESIKRLEDHKLRTLHEDFSSNARLYISLLPRPLYLATLVAADTYWVNLSVVPILN